MTSSAPFQTGDSTQSSAHREPFDESRPAAPTGGEGRIGTLRGASARVDPRRLVQGTLAVVVATLLVFIVVLTAAGVHTNQQYDELHSEGVPVTVTVTKCLGLLGGTGSNLVGYSCRGSYMLDGHRYEETIPGNSYHHPGATIPAIAVPGNPRLVSPVSLVATQHSSASVFIVPALLTAVLLALVAVVTVRRRSHRRHAGTSKAATGRLSYSG